jgi:hypothetical protein
VLVEASNARRSGREFMTMEAPGDRLAFVRRGLRLNYLTIGYNLVEAIISVGSGSSG